MPAPTRSILTIPTSDLAFAEYVAATSEKHPRTSAAEFERLLRRIFPRVVVRERSLSGETPSWYVYRDGAWRPEATGPWWVEPGLPRVVVSDEGWMTDINKPAAELLGIPATDTEPRHFTDFVVPGRLAEAAQLFDVVLTGRELDATIVLRPTSGDAIAVAVHSKRESDHVVGTFRLADDVDLPDDAQSTAPRPTASYVPATDVAFRAYAQRALERMSDPTPEGMELRIRRLYPHAHVDRSEAGWLVHRDRDGVVPQEVQWWLDPSVARARYDAQALILEANDSARHLFRRELEGHHWQEFVTAGSTDEVDVMLAILAEVGAAESRFRLPMPDGSLLEFDSYTEVDGDEFVSAYRLVPS